MTHGVIGPSSTPALNESLPVPSLTLLILLLIPCVVLLLLVNCFILGYKLITLRRKRRKKRRLRSSDSSFTISTQSTGQSRITKLSEVPSFANQGGRREPCSVSTPSLAQSVPSSPMLSKQKAVTGQRISFYRPDGTAGEGSGSLRPPSTILAAMSSSASTTRADLPHRPRVFTHSYSDWRRGVRVVPLSSDSEADRANTVPPNSPATVALPARNMLNIRPIRRSSTMELQNERQAVIPNPTEMIGFEYASSIPPEESELVISGNSSTLGPGLDSDFGASAGISLRILSSDSEVFPTTVWASGLEWDYYDPSYKRRSQMHRHLEHVPTVSHKQYWV